MIVKYSLPSKSRVPRPMICLNSIIELIGRISTMLRTLLASTPVESFCEVVRMVGIVFSLSLNSAQHIGRRENRHSPSRERSSSGPGAVFHLVYKLADG